MKETWGLGAQREGAGTPPTQLGERGSRDKRQGQDPRVDPEGGVGWGINAQQTERRRRRRWETRFVA